METSYSNKPYFFVPLLDSANRRKAPSRQDILSADTKTGKFDITIKCETPLHFGSGQLLFDESTKRFTHSLIRENGRIALPGSSFKGMLRSVFESITESCVVLSANPSIYADDKAHIKQLKEDIKSKIGGLQRCDKKSKYLCPACSVFGHLSHKGKLTISSFYSDTEPVILRIPQLEQPFKTYPRPARGERDNRTGNERLYYGKFSEKRGLDVAKMSKADFLTLKKREPQSGGNFYGRKFYKHSGNWKTLADSSGRGNYECLPAGAILKGWITYQGLTEDELGGLLFALGLGLGWEKPIYHKLGYAKPAFFGSAKLTVQPEPLLRYEDKPMSTADAENKATKYYEKHKSAIGAAVNAIEHEWTEIGNSMWTMNEGRYGY